MSKVYSSQIWDKTKAAYLDTILAALTIGSAATSITLPDGTIVKWGDTGAFASIGANTVATETLVFPVAFPEAVEFFHAILTPALSADFFGVTSLVAKSTTQVQFTVKNGATPQTIASGLWIAIGR